MDSWLGYFTQLQKMLPLEKTEGRVYKIILYCVLELHANPQLSPNKMFLKQKNQTFHIKCSKVGT